MLTDESHHTLVDSGEPTGDEGGAMPTVKTRAVTGSLALDHSHGPAGHFHRHADGDLPSEQLGGVAGFIERQRPALLLGTMYAVGHGAVVFALGTTAILAKQILPDWIDSVMERVVGVTLLFLAAYLFYSLYRFFRGGGEFRLRSRWMLVFSGVRNTWGAVRERLFGRPHEHVHTAQQYGVRTAIGIGMIHGVGAETGTQALVIATAVGASSQAAGILALAAFLVGLLISNSVVTVISTAGFVSSSQRRSIYVAAGLFAAVFSLVVGLIFVFDWAAVLPSLDPFG